MENELRNVFGLREEEFYPKSSKEYVSSKFSRAYTMLGIMKVISVLLSIAMGGFWYIIGQNLFGRYAENEVIILAIIGGVVSLVISLGIILLLSFFIDMCRDIRAVKDRLENK